MTIRLLWALLLIGPLAGCVRKDLAQRPRRSDYAVYEVVIRDFFLRSPSGEHGFLCEDGTPAQLAIGNQTRPLWPHTPRRDSAAAAELPDVSAPLVAALRAMDALPRGSLAADSFAVGIPIRLHRDSVPNPEATTQTESIAQLAEHAPAAIQFSRVAYNADSTRALVYAMQKCRDEFEVEAEEGAQGVALLVPLERREERWVALDPVYLHVD